MRTVFRSISTRSRHLIFISGIMWRFWVASRLTVLQRDILLRDMDINNSNNISQCRLCYPCFICHNTCMLSFLFRQSDGDGLRIHLFLYNNYRFSCCNYYNKDVIWTWVDWEILISIVFNWFYGCCWWEILLRAVIAFC